MTSLTWNINLQNSVNRLFEMNALIKENVNEIIEIGCFEGHGTRRLYDIFNKPSLQIHCIDPWDEGYVLSNPKFDDINPIFVGQWNKFITNTEQFKNNLVIHRGYSNEILPTIEKNTIDFIYIDGDHSENQVYLDGKLAFPAMKKNSIILFDDYYWNHNGEFTQKGIERFIDEHSEYIDVLFRGPVQCAVKVK